MRVYKVAPCGDMARPLTSLTPTALNHMLGCHGECREQDVPLDAFGEQVSIVLLAKNAGWPCKGGLG